MVSWKRVCPRGTLALIVEQFDFAKSAALLGVLWLLLSLTPTGARRTQMTEIEEE